MNSKSLLLYLSVNILFILKYVGRFDIVYAVIAALVYCSLVCLVYRYIDRIHVSHRLLLYLMAISVVCLVVLQYSIDPYELRVDRWSAIHNFLYNLFHGIYPYSAQTHLGGYGSPFPVWQLIHVPFYLCGNVGLSFLLGLCLFVYAVYKVFGDQAAASGFVFLMLSPGFLYEVAVRSDLMTNSLVVCAFVCYLRYNKMCLDRQWFVIALLCGMMMSSRLIVVIPLLIYLLNDYCSSGWQVKIGFPFVVLMTFAATFLPFLLWDGEMLLFFEYSPFVLQSRQGNVSDFALFIPLCIWCSLSWKNDFYRYMSNTALFLIVFIAVTFIHNMYQYSNLNELFDAAYDISYFNMSLPFTIIALTDRRALS